MLASSNRHRTVRLSVMHLCAASALLIGLPGAELSVLRAEAPPVLEKRFPSAYHVTQTVTLRRNTMDLSGAQDPEFILAVPFPRSNEYQEIRNFQASSGEILYFPETHDGYVRVKFTSPPKGVTISYDVVTYRIFTRWERLKPLMEYDKTTADYQTHTRSFGRIETGHREIDAAARQLRKQSKTDLDYIRKAYLWEQQKLKWKVTGRYFKLDEIFQNGGGDSAALATVFIALLRNQGIPARYMTGFKFGDTRVENHVWAEFYLEGQGWFPADPSFFAGESLPYLGYHDGRRVFFNQGQQFTIETANGTFPVPEMQSYQTYYSMRGGQIWGNFDYLAKVTATPVKVFDEKAFFNDPARVRETANAALEVINNHRRDLGFIPVEPAPQVDELAQKMIDHPEAGDVVKTLQAKRIERWNITQLIFMSEPAEGAAASFPKHLIDDPNWSRIGIGYRFDGKQHSFYFIFVED